MSAFRIFLSVLVLVAVSPAFAMPEDDDYGSNAFTTDVDAYHPAVPSIHAGLDLQYVPVHYQNYVWGDGSTSTKSGHGARIGLEWIPFPERYGKLGFGGGIAYYDISKVTLSDSSLGELQVFPVDAYIAYRLDYWRNQLLVPFVKVGPEVAVLHELHRDGSPIYYGMNYVAGMELLLDRIDWSSAKSLERTTGIHHTYVSVEYLRNRYLGKDSGPDLTRDEVRLGMRFEM